jgi:protein tyrosine/serine phosphatase
VPLALFAAATGCAHLKGNLQTVEPGAYYRSGQMDATTLDITIRRHGIKTVVNLRGESPHESWYRDERTLCSSLGVAHHDLDWTMSRPPDPESLQTFASLVRAAEKPILVHCQGGVHRAAIAAACYRLLQGETVEDARDELGFFFNGAPIGQLLDLYQCSTDPFERWLSHDYPLQYEALGFERREPDTD